MKRLFWVSLLLGAYIWSVTTGRDQFVLDQGKKIYQLVTAWFEDAEIDFQITSTESPPTPAPAKKKRSRRWD